MGTKIKINESENINIFLDEILNATQEVEERFLKRAGQAVKKIIVQNLNILRTKNDNPEYKHMADDVIVRTVKDVYGHKVVRVRGGRKTGTLWHIVNDGTYRSKATHFIDNATYRADTEINNILEEEMAKEGFK